MTQRKFFNATTNVKVCCTKEDAVNTPVFTHATANNIQRDIKVVLIDIKTVHEGRHIKKELIDTPVNMYAAITDA